VKTLKTIVLQRGTIVTLVTLLVLAGSAIVSRADVTTVRMKIAGYLCGN
jgi:hypothetical protein